MVSIRLKLMLSRVYLCLVAGHLRLERLHKLHLSGFRTVPELHRKRHIHIARSSSRPRTITMPPKSRPRRVLTCRIRGTRPKKAIKQLVCTHIVIPDRRSSSFELGELFRFLAGFGTPSAPNKRLFPRRSSPK